MINRYTLKYKDDLLETKYQQHWFKIKRKPVAKVVSWGSLVIVITRIIEDSITSQIQKYSALEITQQYSPYFFLIFVLWVAIYYQSNRGIKWILFTYSHFLTFAYYWTVSSELDSSVKLLLFSICISQIIIIQTSEFLEGVYLIIFCAIFCFATQLIQNGKIISYYISVCIVASTALFINGHRKNLKAYRSQFQLQFLDNQWQKIVFDVIKNDFLLFYYDDTNICFKLNQARIKNNEINTTDELKLFIRQIKIKDQTLEQYCFKQIQNHQIKVENEEQNKTTLIAIIKNINNGKSQQVVLDCSILFGSCITVLIKFQSHQFTQSQNEFIDQIENSYQFQFKHTFGLYYSLILKNNLKPPNKDLQKFSKLFLFQYLKFQLKQFSLKYQTKFKIVILFQLLKKIYYLKEIDWNKLKNESMFHNKYLILILLMRIVEACQSKQITFFVQSFPNKQCQIKVKSIFNEKLTKVLYNQLEQNQQYRITISQEPNLLILALDNFDPLASFEERNSLLDI